MLYVLTSKNVKAYIYLYTYISIHLYISLYISISIFLSISIHISIYPYISLYIYDTLPIFSLDVWCRRYKSGESYLHRSAKGLSSIVITAKVNLYHTREVRSRPKFFQHTSTGYNTFNVL